MNDLELRYRIVSELGYDPSIDATNVAVTVEKGIASLFGHVESYVQKSAAAKAARRVAGVRAVANEIEVRYPEMKKHGDDQIASRALDIIAWDTTLPDGAVDVKVDGGWVTLSGSVPWRFHRAAAEDAVRRLGGVVGVVNLISVVPHALVEDVARRIVAAFKRNAELDADGIRVSVNGNQIALEGSVHNLLEREKAEAVAWSVPGVDRVQNRLSID